MAAPNLPDCVCGCGVSLEEFAELRDYLHELQFGHGRNMGASSGSGSGDNGSCCRCRGYECIVLLFFLALRRVGQLGHKREEEERRK